MKPLIILVEENALISESFESNLLKEGYRVIAFSNGESMLAQKASFVNLVLFILDIVLLGMDTFTICTKIRQIPDFADIPIVLLAPEGYELDRAKLCEADIHDYITKSYITRESILRINANVRRYIKMINGSLRTEVVTNSSNEYKSINSIYSFADICLDDRKHKVYKGKKEIEMTYKEYELLKFMMSHRGTTYTREAFLINVWGYEYSGSARTVDVHIRQIRRKIEEDDANPRIIETVRGKGYRFTER